MWYNTVLFSLSSFPDGGFFWLYIRKELTEAELDTLRAADVALGRVWSEPPTLNDVFLEITGRELRD